MTIFGEESEPQSPETVHNELKIEAALEKGNEQNTRMNEGREGCQGKVEDSLRI